MLRNKTTGDVYLVVVVTLFLKEDVNEDGTIKDGVEGKIIEHDGHDEEDKHDEEEVLKKAREELGAPHHETEADDVD